MIHILSRTITHPNIIIGDVQLYVFRIQGVDDIEIIDSPAENGNYYPVDYPIAFIETYIGLAGFKDSFKFKNPYITPREFIHLNIDVPCIDIDRSLFYEKLFFSQHSTNLRNERIRDSLMGDDKQLSEYEAVSSFKRSILELELK